MSERIGPAVGGAGRLSLENDVGVSLLPRVEEEDPALKLANELGPYHDRFDIHRVVGVEAQIVDPAECRCVLILATDGLFENVDFYVASFAGKLLASDEAASHGIERVQHADSKAAARPHSSAGRDVADGRDFDRAGDLRQLHRLAYQLMFEIVDRRRRFRARIGHADVPFEPPVNGYIDVTLDRHAEHCAVIPAIKRRQIRASTSEAHAVRVCVMIMALMRYPGCRLRRSS